MLAVLLSVGSVIRAGAIEYSNVDSISVHGLTYLGAIDRNEYGYEDSIHVLYRAANRSSVPISISAGLRCPSAFVLEVWCDSLTHVCTDPFDLFPCRDGSTFTIPPGVTVVERYSQPPFRAPGPNFRFGYGSVAFYNPWAGLRFGFYLHYVRVREPTAVVATSWSAIKSLYRR